MHRTNKIQQSPTDSVLSDEVTDIVSHKHLAMLCRYVKSDVGTDTVLLNDVAIADGTANTITAAISDGLQAQQLDVVKRSTLSADGASTFRDKRRGVRSGRPATKSVKTIYLQQIYLQGAPNYDAFCLLMC